MQATLPALRAASRGFRVEDHLLPIAVLGFDGEGALQSVRRIRNDGAAFDAVEDRRRDDTIAVFGEGVADAADMRRQAEDFHEDDDAAARFSVKTKMSGLNEVSVEAMAVGGAQPHDLARLRGHAHSHPPHIYIYGVSRRLL